LLLYLTLSRDGKPAANSTMLRMLEQIYGIAASAEAR